ncbi:MraY family glycosyltransferase [Algoriphagus mannitolivorans]|uniref:UDP-GlcNAc--UDP-phosphate GlcNAc-1-phosphate transferase n=1 Tax=Algoriphagus mannitolivorans TaxID=226504 RepID=UPI00146FA763|nr:UDP-GlcNAc--UDP-phosphate GlcNAc-1-phosphate transferase [Algoriphagus mannitolivorans]
MALVYQRLALRFGIIDVPNGRSSHALPTVRGGGILFPFAVIFWWMAYDFMHTWMVLGIVWIATISLLDDMYSISRKLRFGVQALGLTMAFFDLGLFEQESMIMIPFLYFVGLGIMNAINFMDGINGITGIYGLVFMGSVLAINQYMPVFEESLIRYLIISLVVFLIFNMRKKAIMFAGDIGSISLAYMMIYFLTQWYLATKDWTIILMLIVYGVDSFVTLTQRILRKENPAIPHRTHLYQFLVNQCKKDHVMIALLFGVLQFAFNFFLYIYPQSMPSNTLGVIVLLATIAVYLLIKLPIERKFASS